MRTPSRALTASGFSPLFLSTPFYAELSAGTQAEQHRNGVGCPGNPGQQPNHPASGHLESEWFAETFKNNLKPAEKHGALEEYRVPEGGVLIPLDGVWYYSSGNIHCEHCPHKSKGGETAYYHSMVAGAVVLPVDMG
jgi:hypothetical protein